MPVPASGSKLLLTEEAYYPLPPPTSSMPRVQIFVSSLPRAGINFKEIEEMVINV
jgi:hypothetical protein